MAEGAALLTESGGQVQYAPPIDTSFKNMNITGMKGGSAQNVIAAGIIHGNVNVGTDEYIHHLEGKTVEDMEIWIEGMVRISAVDTVLQKFREGHNWITVTGSAGEGKTTLGYMVLKALHTEGQTVFKLDTPEDYIHVARRRKDSVIMLNDIFGAFIYDASQMSKWQSVIHSVLDEHEKSKAEMNQTRVILISRRNVLNGAKTHLGLYSRVVLDEECVVDLSETEKLEERLEILNFHLNDATRSMIPNTVKERVASMKTPHGFPHCCKLYAELMHKDEEVINIEEFFQSPLQFLDCTTKVLTENKQFMTLFKLMIRNDGELDVSSISDEQQRNDIQSAVSELMGSYLKKNSGVIMFSHPSIYESVATSIGEKDVVFLLQNATILFLMHKININQSDMDHSGFINIDPGPNVIDILVERFQQAILDKDFRVFEISRLCENAEFCLQLVKRSCHCSKNPLRLLKKKKKLYIDERNNLGDTMLHTAEYSESYTAARVLLENGANVNRANKRNEITPLHIALGRKPVQLDHIMLLIRNGADVNKQEKQGLTALNILMGNDLPEVRVAELLISHGADVNKSDSRRQTPLHYLCDRNKPDEGIELIELLIKHGANVNAVKTGGITPLHCVCTTYRACTAVRVQRNKLDSFRLYKHLRKYADSGQSNSVKAVELLMKQGAEVNKTDTDGKTALHHLCTRLQPDVRAIELLIQHGADLNISDKNGRTALHLLHSRFKPDAAAAELLVKHGADTNIADRDGKTAHDYNADIIASLLADISKTTSRRPVRQQKRQVMDDKAEQSLEPHESKSCE